jgi:hypothetical protein
VEIAVDANGKVQSTRVISGPDELADPVVASVKKWSFAPAVVVSPLRINIGFQLPKVVVDSDDDEDDDANVEMDSNSDADSEEDAEEPENPMPDLESALQEAESALEEAESELHDKLGDMTSRVAEAQEELEKLGKIEEHVSLVDGRTLKRVRFLNVSEDSRPKLLKLLPVHEGDQLTKSVIEKVNKAIHDFDSQLDCMIVPVEDSEATIVIRRK